MYSDNGHINDSKCKESNVTSDGIACSSTGRFQDEIPCCCEEKQLFTIKGICSKAKLDSLLTPPTTTDPTKDRRWTQLFIPEILCIPHQKPDVEQLLSVNSVIKIFSQRVVNTPVLITGTPPVAEPVENAEGTMLTGKKLVVEGLLRQKIVYTAAVENQAVHAAHFDVPFSAFIILDQNDPLTRKFKIDACIEDIFVTTISDREIFKNVTIFIKATPIVC